VEALTQKKAAATKEQKMYFRWLMQTDLYALAHMLEDERGTGNLLSPAFHMPLCNYVQTTPYPRNLYLLPRGHFKTSLLTVAKNIQRILLNPQIRILISSNKSENAEAMLTELKGHLLHERLLWGFPEILDEEPAKRFDKWTNSQVTVKRKRKSKEATIEVIGVSGELTSKHFDHATFDDIVGKENSATRELMMGVIDFYKMAQPLMDPGSTQDMIGTTWHYADVYAWLLEQKQKHGMPLGVYFKPCWEPAPPEAIGASLVPSFGWVRPVFPERFTVEHLLQERASMGPSGFAAQYLLNPVSADTTILPRENLRTLSRLEFELLTKDQDLWWCMTVDPAITVNKWSDFSAVAVGAFDRDNNLYIVDLRRGKWRESELVREIYSCYHRYPGIKAIGFEKTGFQRIFMRLFTSEGERTGRFLPIIGLEKDTHKTKQVRIRALEPIWMNGQLVVLEDVPAFADFLEEAERFRTDRESAHDDLLDAVVDLLQVRARPSEPASPFSHLDGDERSRAEFEFSLRNQKPWLSQRAVREAWAIKSTHEMAQAEFAVLGAGRHRDDFFG